MFNDGLRMRPITLRKWLKYKGMSVWFLFFCICGFMGLVVFAACGVTKRCMNWTAETMHGYG